MRNNSIHIKDVFVVKATPSCLELVSDYVQRKAQETRLSFKRTWELMLAVDEICFNITSHAFPDKSDGRMIKIAWKKNEEHVVILLSDNGIPFNPLKVPVNESEVFEENRLLGGMGPYLIEKMVDEVSYKRENGFNCLIIKKNKRNR